MEGLFEQGVPCQMLYVQAGGYTVGVGVGAIHVCRTFRIERCTAEFATLSILPINRVFPGVAPC